MNKSKSDAWTTPPDLYDKLNKEFNFNFDPCPVNPGFDGLEVDWGASNFVNPPYSEWNKWLEKGFNEWKKGKTCVFLIPARTDTIAWHKYIIDHAEVRFIKGRLKFSNHKNSAPFPSAIVIFKSIDQSLSPSRN